jgi:hypothetical protein
VLVENPSPERLKRHLLDEPAGDEHRLEREREDDPRHERERDPLKPHAKQHEKEARDGERSGDD